MGKSMLWLIFMLLCVYALIPGMIVRFFGYRAFKRGSRSNELALTFDDGPHEKYTGRLLDLLKAYGVKATFFVVGKNAEANPDLIRRMFEEGHVIGIHNYFHYSNGVLLPQQVRKQISRAASVVESITGVMPVYYRPPWGIINIFDFITLRKFRLILWSRIVGDWKKSSSKYKLKRKLVKRLKGGEVVLLHDSGDTLGAYEHAPEQMLLALEEYLQEVTSQGYKFVTIDEMFNTSRQPVETAPSMAKRLLIFVWMGWEYFFHVLFQVKRIDPDSRFLQLRIRKYEGKTLKLMDGEEIHSGERIAEMHLNNHLLYQLGKSSRSSMHLAIQLIREMEQAMPKIASYILDNPAYQDVKGLYGISMINRGVTQFGFTVMELPEGVFAEMTKFYLKLLMSVIHPQGKQRLNQKNDMLVPKVLAMSRKELLRRYHPENPAKIAPKEHEIVPGEHGSHAVFGK